jgi:hypothetical protein
VIAPAGIADTLHRRHHDRHVLRLASRHHGVDGDLLRGHRDGAMGDPRHLRLGVEARGIEHDADGGLGGGNDGKAVRPAALEALLHCVRGVVDRDAS